MYLFMYICIFVYLCVYFCTFLYIYVYFCIFALIFKRCAVRFATKKSLTFVNFLWRLPTFQNFQNPSNAQICWQINIHKFLRQLKNKSGWIPSHRPPQKLSRRSFCSKSRGASFEDKCEYTEIYTNIQKCTKINTQIHKYINIHK